LAARALPPFWALASFFVMGAYLSKPLAYCQASRLRLDLSAMPDKRIRKRSDILKTTRRRKAWMASARALGWHSQADWHAMLNRYRRCLKCGVGYRERELTKDHVVPLPLGGSDAITNIQPLCVRCNSQKRQRNTDYRVCAPDTYAGWLPPRDRRLHIRFKAEYRRVYEELTGRRFRPPRVRLPRRAYSLGSARADLAFSLDERRDLWRWRRDRQDWC